MLTALLLSGGAIGQDLAPEFAAFVRAPAAQARGEAVTPQVWEQTLRSPVSLGPPFLREVDAQLLQLTRERRWPEALALVKSGRAQVNARDLRGGGVLAAAAAAGQDNLVRALLERGAERDRIGDDGFTPAGAAAFFGQRSTLRILLRAGADASALGATGQSPLHLAAMTGQRQIIDELLASGVDATLRNRQGETALDVAAERGQQDTMARLIEVGVDPTEAGR